jgi:hypothetical protein
MAHARFNCVAILDAVPDGELATARHLREELRDIAAYRANGLKVRYFRVMQQSDLEAAFSRLEEEAKSSGLLPWVHLDAHGTPDEEGFVTADGSYVSWNALRALITPLNIATNINVVIVLAACYGGSFTKAIRANDRAPVLAVIGSTRKIAAGRVDVDFPAFYKTFFETGSLKSAIGALTSRAEKTLYYRTTAERFFYDVWAGYKASECSEEAIALRARRIFRRLKREGAPRVPSVGHIKRRFRSKERESFERYRDMYFMYDLFPGNRSRFPVSYKEAEDHAAR